MVPFLIPVDANVAFAANYEVKRIGKEAAGVLPEAQVYLSEKEDGYNIIVATVKEFEELSDNTSDEIRNLMIRSVDILDDKNFESLAAAIFGYESYEEASMYYRDEDGFGMTDDEEINLYGAIDRKGKVVKKFTLKR